MTVSSSPRFDELIRAVRAGSETAAQELVEQFGDHILDVIRRTLPGRLRSQFDSMDFHQSVWLSFYRMPPERATFHSPDELAAYLERMARHKVIDAARRHLYSQKCGVRREVFLEDVATPSRGPQATEATASQNAVADEQWERMMQGQSPQVRELLVLMRAGHTHREIAQLTGLHPKVIQRFVRQVKKELLR